MRAKQVMSSFKAIIPFTFFLFSGARLAEASAFGNDPSCQASANSLGSIILRLADEVPGPVLAIFGILTTIASIWLIVTGVLKLRDAVDGEKNATASALVRMVIGGFGMVSNVLLGIFYQTLFSKDVSDTYGYDRMALVNDCLNSSVNSASFLSSFATNFAPYLVFGLFMFAFVAGTILTFACIFKFIDVAAGRSQQKVSSILSQLVVAMFLVNLPFFSGNIMKDTFFGDNKQSSFYSNECNLISYNKNNGIYVNTLNPSDCAEVDMTDINDTATAQKFANLIFTVIFPFGLISMMSGLFVFYSMGQGQQQGPQGVRAAIVRIVAGVFMMNMAALNCAVFATFGLNKLAETNDIVRILGSACNVGSGSGLF